jgi:hypothetical protein
MHTIMVIVGGFLVLGLCLIAGRVFGGAGVQTMVTAVKVFILIWLGATLFNMWVGVTRAGYSVSEEFPIFLLVFAIPVVVALVIWWKFS